MLGKILCGENTTYEQAHAFDISMTLVSMKSGNCVEKGGGYLHTRIGMWKVDGQHIKPIIYIPPQTFQHT